MSALPAITIWQPWASLIAAGCKRYEFRSWPAPRAYIGERIAIHAGARAAKKAEIAALLLKLRSPRWRETGLVDRTQSIELLEKWLPQPGCLPLSSVLCTAVLGQPIRDHELEAAIGVAHVNDSDRDEHSNWGWPLVSVEAVIPLAPARGSQGFWNWTPPA